MSCLPHVYADLSVNTSGSHVVTASLWETYGKKKEEKKTKKKQKSKKLSKTKFVPSVLHFWTAFLSLDRRWGILNTVVENFNIYSIFLKF